MGSFISQNRERLLKNDLLALKTKTEELESSIKKRKEEIEITEIDPYDDIGYLINQEQLRAIKCLECLERVIGLENFDYDEIYSSFKNLENSTDIETTYLNLRIQETNIEDSLCNNLVDVISRIMEMNAEKSAYINNRLAEFEKIVGKDEYLKLMIDEIRNLEINIETNSTGSLKSLSTALAARCDFDKKFELLERKYGYQKFTLDLRTKNQVIADSEQEIINIQNEAENIKSK